jgi:hypothetical protein
MALARSRDEESIDMADNKHQQDNDDNKDAKSGEPVQLDEEQGGQPEGNEAGGQELGAKPAEKSEGGQRT